MLLVVFWPTPSIDTASSCGETFVSMEKMIGGRDVRHDPEGEDRRLTQRTVGQGRDQAEEALRRLLQVLGVHPRNRDLEPDPVRDQKAQRAQDALPGLRDLEQLEEVVIHER